MKWLILGILLLLVAPAVMANDFTTVNNTITLWTDVTTGTAYYAATAVNITIYNSTGSVMVNNVAMQNVATGLYKYDFTPASRGIFYTSSKVFNSTYATVALASSSFAVISPFGGSSSGGASMIPMTAIIMLIVAAILLYISFQMDKEHIIIKFLLLMCAVFTLYLASASLVHTNQYCAITSDTGSPALTCFDTGDNTPTTLHKIIGYLIYLIIGYIVIYIFLKIIDFMRSKGSIN